MNLAMQYVVMKMGDHEVPDMYLCRSRGGFFWTAIRPQRDFELIHITAEDFTKLAHWYWDTFKGETPLETWARRNKVNYDDYLIEISYGIENVVFCGCNILKNTNLPVPLKVFEPRLNTIVQENEVYEWVREKFG